MQKDDAVGIALLGICRGDEKADVQTNKPQHYCQDGKPSDCLARQRIKARRCSVFEPIDRCALIGRY